MAKLSKKAKLIKSKVDRAKQYSVTEAVQILKELGTAKFNEAIDVQNVRGATVLPNGTGKTVRVAVFTQGPNADAAKAAGADIVGMEDLAELVKKGQMDFDVVIASPDAMRVVGQLGQILGPRGLMPNPKVGTVTADVATAVKNAKSGQVRYRTDKAGIIHCTLGKVTFDVADIQGNLEALLSDLRKAKPTAAKGIYIKKITLSSTMGPGLWLDASSIAS
jgi:large subunit ribosomal protein L1